MVSKKKKKIEIKNRNQRDNSKALKDYLKMRKIPGFELTIKRNINIRNFAAKLKIQAIYIYKNSKKYQER